MSALRAVYCWQNIGVSLPGVDPNTIKLRIFLQVRHIVMALELTLVEFPYGPPVQNLILICDTCSRLMRVCDAQSFHGRMEQAARNHGESGSGRNGFAGTRTRKTDTGQETGSENGSLLLA
jgi:hypothetical protein